MARQLTLGARQVLNTTGYPYLECFCPGLQMQRLLFIIKTTFLSVHNATTLPGDTHPKVPSLSNRQVGVDRMPRMGLGETGLLVDGLYAYFPHEGPYVNSAYLMTSYS